MTQAHLYNNERVSNSSNNDARDLTHYTYIQSLAKLLEQGAQARATHERPKEWNKGNLKPC